MSAIIGTRKTTILLRLAAALAVAALVGSTSGDRANTASSRNGSVCFVIDGQIYCIP